MSFFENGMLDKLEAGTFSTLKTIHKYLFDEIVKKYIEINIAHPFREGNGRSPIKDIEIKHILKAALTNDINSREVYIKGIDHSYYYEGYTAFRTEDL